MEELATIRESVGISTTMWRQLPRRRRWRVALRTKSPWPRP